MLYTVKLSRTGLSSQGSALDVFSALANAKSLRHLNLYHDSGLTGPLVPPLSPLQGGCASWRAAPSARSPPTASASRAASLPAWSTTAAALWSSTWVSQLIPHLCRQLT